jgi:hypothetical protein
VSWPHSSAAGADRQEIADPSAMPHPVGQQESETAPASRTRRPGAEAPGGPWRTA